MKIQAYAIESFPEIFDDNNEELPVSDRTVCICFTDEEGMVIAEISLYMDQAETFAVGLIGDAHSARRGAEEENRELALKGMK